MRNNIESFPEIYASNNRLKTSISSLYSQKSAIATTAHFMIKSVITGSALALHCCKAHAKINRKI